MSAVSTRCIEPVGKSWIIGRPVHEPHSNPRFPHLLLRTMMLFERGLTFAAFLILIAVVFGDVLMRELTGNGLLWARQVGVFANVVIVMMGFGLASMDGAHLRPRFADGWTPASWDRVMGRLQEAVMSLFCLGFAIVATGVVLETFELGDMAVVPRIVIWPIQAFIPIAFFLAFIRHGVYAVWPSLRPAAPATSHD